MNYSHQWPHWEREAKRGGYSLMARLEIALQRSPKVCGTDSAQPAATEKTRLGANDMSNLVTWQDEHGGHHTGAVMQEALHAEDVDRMLAGTDGAKIDWRRYVRESCDGILTWVPQSQLKPYLTRSERGEE